MSVDAEVPPLSLSFFPLVDCVTSRPLAYRSKTVIQSIILGSLAEDVYTKVSDRPQLAEEMLYHNLQHAASTLKKMKEAERNVSFISVRAPDSLAEAGDVYRVVSRILSKNPQIDPQTLCLEFPAELMAKDLEKAKKTLLDVKVLKVKTALSGCGKEDFAALKLIELKPDIVFLSPAITAWAGNRNKPAVFSAFVSYIKSMEIAVYAEAKPEQRTALRSAYCDGYMNIGEPPLSEAEAIAQKEDA